MHICIYTDMHMYVRTYMRIQAYTCHVHIYVYIFYRASISMKSRTTGKGSHFEALDHRPLVKRTVARKIRVS